MYMMANMDKCIDPRGSDYLNNAFLDIAKSMGFPSPELACNKFRQMMEDMDMAHPFAEERLKEIEILSYSVNPIRLKNNPVYLDESSIRSLYEIIVK